MAFRNMSNRKRLAILFDLSNLNESFQRIIKEYDLPNRTKIDFERLVSLIATGFEVVHKSIYMAKRVGLDSNKIVSQNKFIENLRSRGFKVIAKDSKVITQNDGSVKIKGDMDVEITTDASELIWRRDCDELVLVSGDSDFTYFLERANSYGVNITVVSSRNSISQELARLATRVILLEEIDIRNYTFSSNPKSTSY